MAESRLVPCNLMAWPRIRDLLPDQKLLVYHLWVTCHEASGCQLLDLASFQGATSITVTAIQEALGEFQRRGMLDQDPETGEVFIKDWYRFHKFESPARRRLAEDSIRRIQSPRLRAIVEESGTYVLREGKGRGGKGREDKKREEPPPIERAEGLRPSGKRASGPLSGAGGDETGTSAKNKYGICLQAGNARDGEAMREIELHTDGEIVQAVSDARGRDPQGRAWPTAVLRSLLRARRPAGAQAETQAPAWARIFTPAHEAERREIDVTPMPNASGGNVK